MKLSEIEQAIDEYEESLAKFVIAHRTSEDIQVRNAAFERVDSAEKALKALPVEVLRSLLAVAKAASVLMKASPDYDTYKLKEDALKEALKELEG